MFLRIVKAAGAKGVQHEYVRLVEAYREEGKNKQRVVCNLGRKELLLEHLDALNRLLRGEASKVPKVGDIEAEGSWDFGPMLVSRRLWEELELGKILAGLGVRSQVDGLALSDRALVLVGNRLCCPASEHGLARWLETDYVCDRRGRRWVAQWRDENERRLSGRPRVRVAYRQLNQWYRTLDQLWARRKEIEKGLYLRLRDLFSLKVDLVLYDLTSTYFEGRGPAGLGAHGYSRDGKPRNRQVLVGLVMVDGWPITHHVFVGNERDGKTVPAVVRELEERFGIGRVVFVGDRGMMLEGNVELLRSQGQGYVMGLARRRRPEILQYLERATGEWLECPVGIVAREKAQPPKTLVQEVSSEQAGVRVFVVHSEERLEYERGQRKKAMEKVRGELEALAVRVEKGKLKQADKVGAAAARILSRHHGSRYYQWEYKEGKFRFFEHAQNLKQEEAIEGKYLIQTEEKGLSALEAVRIYKELTEVERAFSNLKDVIEMRPIYHQTDRRVEAHIFIATLAFLLHRLLEKRLKAAGIDLSATEALQALKTVRVVEFTVDGETKRCVTRGSGRAAAVLRALGIQDLAPPTPPKHEATVV